MSGRNPFDGILAFGMVVGAIAVILLAAFIGLGWWLWQNLQWVP